MQNQLIECVPNFSEGRNSEVIEKIASEIRSVRGVKLLNIDPGKAAHRTVFTFVGEPNDVVEAAFKAIKKASELIDMCNHSGEHPRIGATDVCPLIPLANITIEETLQYAEQLGKRVGEELNIPVFLYESSAKKPERRNLATIREGEYEGLITKLQDENWKPDFGPAEFNARCGATVIGVRDFLVAYNINLNTKSAQLASAIARDVRESGRIKRNGNPVTGEIVLDHNGNPERYPGTLKSVKAIGWYIEEYRRAQVSMNLVNLNETPIHIAFEEVAEKARERGLRVTGSEIIGMVPKKVMIQAGEYYLEKQNRSIGIPEEEVIEIAVQSLGLSDLAPFNFKERIIEYMLEAEELENPLNRLTIKEYCDRTAADTPTPGGGCTASLVGALGASLCTMTANLSANKKGWEDQVSYFSDVAHKGQKIKDELLRLVDEDAKAFDKVMNAYKLPKEKPEEIAERKKAINEANIYASEIPLKIMETAYESFALTDEMVHKGLPGSMSDATVGALCTLTAIEGAYLNIMANIKGLSDPEKRNEISTKAKEILHNAREQQKLILDFVRGKLGIEE